MSINLMPSQHAGEPPADASGRLLCERSLNWDGELPRCGEPAIARIRAMCVHEHLGDAYICAACLSALREVCCDDSEWECQDCHNGAQPHDCLMPMTVTELAVTP